VEVISGSPKISPDAILIVIDKFAQDGLHQLFLVTPISVFEKCIGKILGKKGLDGTPGCVTVVENRTVSLK
jgi:hypothetical protein